MKLQHAIRPKRLVAALFLLTGSVVPGLSGQPHPTSARAASGTVDPHALDTTNEYYTAAGAATNLKLYNAPVGVPNAADWAFSDTTPSFSAPPSSVAAQSVAAQSAAPGRPAFNVQLATSGGLSTLATLTSEDGVKLGLGLASISGAQLAPATAQVDGGAVSYAGIDTSRGVALSVRPTVSGLDVRLVLARATVGGQASFTLNPDSGVNPMQDASGTITGRRQVTQTSQDGTTTSYLQDEWTLELPTVRDSSTDLAASAFTGPVSLSLGQAGSATQQVVVSVDPAWLHDPRRVFPVTVDLPVATTLSLHYSGMFGTVSSCSPATPATLSRVLVGVQGACTYRGQAYFDTRSLAAMSPSPAIQSATLNLYTPTRTGPTGVQALVNAQAYGEAPLNEFSAKILPSWNNAPQVLSGTTGAVQSQSNGQWQQWDVTGAVQRWVKDNGSNGGLTLANSGSVVSFASPLGSGIDGPTLAPYLDITYAQPSAAIGAQIAGAQPLAVSPQFSDGSTNIFGLSGDFSPDDQFPNSDVVNGAMKIRAAKALGAGYMRVNAVLECTPSLPDPGLQYWLDQRIYRQISDAVADGIVPVIDIIPNFGPDKTAAKTQCPNKTNQAPPLAASFLAAQVASLVRGCFNKLL